MFSAAALGTPGAPFVCASSWTRVAATDQRPTRNSCALIVMSRPPTESVAPLAGPDGSKDMKIDASANTSSNDLPPGKAEKQRLQGLDPRMLCFRMKSAASSTFFDLGIRIWVPPCAVDVGGRCHVTIAGDMDCRHLGILITGSLPVNKGKFLATQFDRAVAVCLLASRQKRFIRRMLFLIYKIHAERQKRAVLNASTILLSDIDLTGRRPPFRSSATHPVCRWPFDPDTWRRRRS